MGERVCPGRRLRPGGFFLMPEQQASATSVVDGTNKKWEGDPMARPDKAAEVAALQQKFVESNAAVLTEGDIIGIDFGLFKQGYCADTARTVLIGRVSPERAALVAATEAALEAAIAACVVGNRIGDLGVTIQNYAESRGYSVVTKFVGHGIGTAMHEDPQVPNFGRAGEGKRLKRGLVIAVEPMVNAGAPDVEVLDDKWTVITKDGRVSAHFEHTIAILDEGPLVLTRSKT